MSDDKDEMGQDLQEQLRIRAEAQLARAGAVVSSSVDEILHELQVHQIELAMQNEELQRALAELEASRDRYFDLYEFAPISYFTLDADGVIVDINLTGVRLLGMVRQKAIKQRFAQFVADQAKDRWHRLFLGMMGAAKGERHDLELMMNRHDGTPFHAHLDCMRRDDDGAIPMLRIALSDISQLKQAEAELRIAAIAFESQEGMMVTDANNVILKVNQAFTDTTGYTAEEAIGRTPSILKSGHHDAAFYARMWESIHRTGTWQGEIVDKRRNGELYSKRLIITAVKDDEGIVTHYVGTHSEITDRSGK